MNLVSIIVPVYNVKDRLEKCVNSIILQTYKNIEILLIDDGSTDGSSNICELLKEKDKRISVYHKENGGLSDARNYGINLSTGDYFLFIDSDDVINVFFVETLINSLIKNEADIVAVDIMQFHNDFEIEKICFEKVDAEEEVYSNEGAITEYLNPKDEAKRKISHGLCPKMYKRELFDGLRFEMGRLHEDLFITYKLIDKCNKLVFIDSPYYYYYQNNKNSICNNYTSKNFYDEYEALKRIERYFTGRDDVIVFCTEQYRSMMTRNMPDVDRQVVLKKRTIMRWTIANLWKVKCISKGRIMKLYVSLFFPKLYSYYCKLRGR